MTTSNAVTARHLGRSLERVEDAALLTGRGRYADDLGERPGTLHAAILRSPHAHATVVAVDASAAEACPGVRAVLTGEDVRRTSRPFLVGVKQPMAHWALAVDRVRYAGEPVAVVVAESRYLAEDALEAIRVDYEPLPAVVTVRDAISEDAPLLHPEVGSNVVSDRRFRYGDPEAAFTAAAHRIGLDIEYPRNSCTPIECGVVVAEALAGDGGYEVMSNFMGPFSLHAVMALALKVPAARLRHRVAPDSGGSFGVKQSLFTYVVLMCLASRKANAPVKWVEDRLEHLAAATSSTGRVARIEAAVENDGTINALSYDQFDDVGGYLRAPEPATFYRMHGCLTGAYAVRHLAVRNRVVVTNKTPAGLVRGFGGPQVYFALERLVQRIAVELELDPLDVYRRNFVPAGVFPYRAPAGALLDSGDYGAVLSLAVREGGLDELRRRREIARAQGKLYGIGYAAVVEPSVSNMGYITAALTPQERARAGPKNGAIATATVSVDLLGGVNVVVASAPAGQGHATVLAQVVADALGLQPGEIVVDTALDTGKDAWSVASGNYSSRFAGAVAGAAHLAAMRVRAKLASMAARQLGIAADAVEFVDGTVRPRGEPTRALSFARAAGIAHWSPALLPEGMDPGLRETVFWTPEVLAAPDAEDRVNGSAAYGFIFDICAVEIDRGTGRVCIDRYVTAHDAGTLLNPALANGQIRGAFAQGLGAALSESFVYGADGSFLSGTFADYLVPTAAEVPEPVILHKHTPSPFTPLGAKGLGEGNNMSTPVCIANAVADAVSTLPGVEGRAIQLPLTPARVMALIGIDDPPPSGGAAAALQVPSRAKDVLAASGSVDIAASPEAVFEVLLDAQRLARVIPGCHALERIDETHYRGEVSVGVGLVKARYGAQIALTDIDRPRCVRLAGSGASSLGTVSGSGTVTLEPTQAGARLSYDYRAQVGGKVAAVGSRMLEGAVRIVLSQFFERLGREARGEAESHRSWWRRLFGRQGRAG